MFYGFIRTIKTKKVIYSFYANWSMSSVSGYSVFRFQNFRLLQIHIYFTSLTLLNVFYLTASTTSFLVNFRRHNIQIKSTGYKPQKPCVFKQT